MAIPKKIHYVWVGGKEKPKDIQRCMKTWKKFLKDYEIIEWNENNFDINSHPFVKAAYEAKKWAFVSDYIRAYALYTQGGVYFDTDIIMVDSIDDLLENRAFVGYEAPEFPFTAVFGAEKGHPFVKDILDSYENVEKEFDFKNNNTISVSKILIDKYECELGNKEQMLPEGIKVYRDGVLCNISKETKTIHVFTTTWLDRKSKFAQKIYKFIKLRLTSKFRVNLYVGYLNLKARLKGKK